MIPGKLVRFLEEYANVAFAGIRDRDLVPFGHRVCGWRVGSDQHTMTILFPDQSSHRLLELLQQNGELAVTVEQFPSHETYQFKGRCLRHRDAHHDDVQVVDRIRGRFVKSMRSVQIGLPEDVLKAFVLSPAVAVDMAVSEIYLQTPGPGAGTRLIPPVDQ